MSDYGFVHEGRVFTPNATVGVAPVENDARNKAIEQIELADWRMRPRQQLAYYVIPDVIFDQRNRPASWSNRDAKVTTWLGTVIGRITHVSLYRHNFGGRFVSLRVRGTNGAMYHGRASWDHGTCVVLRRMKD